MTHLANLTSQAIPKQAVSKRSRIVSTRVANLATSIPIYLLAHKSVSSFCHPCLLLAFINITCRQQPKKQKCPAAMPGLSAPHATKSGPLRISRCGQRCGTRAALHLWIWVRHRRDATRQTGLNSVHSEPTSDVPLRSGAASSLELQQVVAELRGWDGWVSQAYGRTWWSRPVSGPGFSSKLLVYNKLIL